MKALPGELQSLLRRHVFKGMSADGEPMQLHYRRIYILPSRQGLVFALMLMVMWLGSVNYNNSLGYLLTFLLTGLALVAIVHTFRNLVGLRLRPLQPEPVFAGEPARFPLRLDNPDRRPRPAITLRHGGREQAHVDLGAERGGRLQLELPTQRRGLLRPGRIALATRYPGGLFRAWSWVDPDWQCLVYPRPEAGPVPDPRSAAIGGQGGSRGEGDDDFSGLRGYRPGDSPRRIAWRSLAAGGELHTKQFAGQAPSRLWLDWHALAELTEEARLSRLTRWVIDAERRGQPYGLRLPALEIPPANGRAHYHRCLRALALYP